VQTHLKLYHTQNNGCAYIPFYSARGCSQTLEPLQTVESFRTIKGDLVSFHQESQLKYASIIECKDVHPLALDGIWPGMRLFVECICLLITPQLSGNQRVLLKRAAVDASLWVHPLDSPPTLLPQECIDQESQEVRLPADLSKGHISYRPRLHMMVQEFSIKTHEWEGETGWKMKLIEL
jgi:hypothetical protein